MRGCCKLNVVAPDHLILTLGWVTGINVRTSTPFEPSRETFLIAGQSTLEELSCESHFRTGLEAWSLFNVQLFQRKNDQASPVPDTWAKRFLNNI